MILFLPQYREHDGGHLKNSKNPCSNPAEELHPLRHCKNHNLTNEIDFYALRPKPNSDQCNTSDPLEEQPILPTFHCHTQDQSPEHLHSKLPKETEKSNYQTTPSVHFLTTQIGQNGTIHRQKQQLFCYLYFS